MFLSTFVSGCAPVSPTASEDRAIFERLCDAPDRNFVKRKLVVKGYAEARENRQFTTCPVPGVPMKLLVENSFKFYECQETKWMESDSLSKDIFRVELYSKGSELCDKDRIAKENIRASRFVSEFPKLKTSCFGITRTDEFKSRYVFVRGGGIVEKDGTHHLGYPKDWPNRLGAISFSRNRIVDMHTGDVIAEERTYIYFPSRPKFSDFTGITQCKVDDSKIEKVFAAETRK